MDCPLSFGKGERGLGFYITFTLLKSKNFYKVCDLWLKTK